MLVVITSPDAVNSEVAHLESFLDAGASRVHVRKPNWTKNQLADFLEEFHSEKRSKVTVHLLSGEHELPQGFSAHLPERLRGEATDGARSTSCHSLECVNSNSSRFEYMLLGPLFSSISKPNYSNPKLREDITRSTSTLQRCVAVGGVTPESFAKLKELGFLGGAVLGYIWNNSSPPYQSFLSVRDKYREAYGVE
jgi:thiamine-phosphate pyrophosphorylase